MEKNRSPKLLLLAFAGLILGIFGVSKSDFASKISWLNQEKLALSGNNTERICFPETTVETKEVRNVSLFVTCAGFLE